MEHLAHPYDSMIIHILSGDQLTTARTHSSKIVCSNGIGGKEKLEGLVLVSCKSLFSQGK